MDQTWIYRNIHLILPLLFIRTCEISSKETYYTKAGTWKEAMTNCTKSGGVPLTYLEVNSNTEFTLKDNRTVWTADYIYLEDVTDIAEVIPTNEYECGYRTFDRDTSKYHPRKGTQYDQCTARKQYVCHSSYKGNQWGRISTWHEAFSNCSLYESYALWPGKSFSANLTVNNVDIWINKARRVTHMIFNEAITIDVNNIETCGTSAEEVKRYSNKNCEQHLESVCAFGQADDSTDKVVTTICASLTTCCILIGIGIGLFCYWKQRRRKFNENTTTVRYDNENLPTLTTTDRNTPVTNGGVNAIACAADIADQNYEECNAPSRISTMDDMYTTPEQHGEYSACHNASAIQIEESEYDSTRNIKESEKSSNIYNTLGFEGAESVYDNGQYNIKESEKSSNIYNTLGFEGAESVYDNGQYNKGKGVHVDSSTYSSLSIQDTTYDTTA